MKFKSKVLIYAVSGKPREKSMRNAFFHPCWKFNHASNCSNKDIFERKIAFQSKLWQLLNLLNLTLRSLLLLNNIFIWTQTCLNWFMMRREEKGTMYLIFNGLYICSTFLKSHRGIFKMIFDFSVINCLSFWNNFHDTHKESSLNATRMFSNDNLVFVGEDSRNIYWSNS